MFQDLSPNAFSYEQPRLATPRPQDEVRDLVRRYPNLSEVDLARLINLYRELSALDMALMLSDGRVAPALDQFAADHRSRLRKPFRQYAALVGYAVVGVAVLAWAIAVAP